MTPQAPAGGRDSGCSIKRSCQPDGLRQGSNAPASSHRIRPASSSTSDAHGHLRNVRVHAPATGWSEPRHGRKQVDQNRQQLHAGRGLCRVKNATLETGNPFRRSVSVGASIPARKSIHSAHATWQNRPRSVRGTADVETTADPCPAIASTRPAFRPYCGSPAGRGLDPVRGWLPAGRSRRYSPRFHRERWRRDPG